MASRDVDVRITTNAARFAAQMGRADRAMVGLGRASRTASTQMASIEGRMRSIEGASRRAQQALGAFLSIQAIRQVGAFAGRLTEASRNLVAQADALGVASDRLEAFQRVMADSGATVEQTVSGLSQLTRNIGLAAQEAGPAFAVFRRFGIAIRDSTGGTRDAISVYQDLVRALESVDARARAAALGLAAGEEAARLFGANAAQGASALEGALERAGQRGLASDAQNRQLADLNNTFRSLQETLTTLARVVLARFSTDIREVILQLRSMTSSLVSIEQSSMAVTGAIAEVVSRFRELWRFAGLAIQTLAAFTLLGRVTRIFRFFGRALGPIGARLQDILRIGTGVIEGMGRFGRTLLAVASAIGPFVDRLLGFGAAFVVVGRLRDAITNLFAPLRSLANAFRELDGATLSAQESMRSLTSAFETAQEISPEVARRFEGEFQRLSRRFQDLINNRLFQVPNAMIFDEATIERMKRELAVQLSDLAAEINRALFNTGEEAGRSLSRAVERGLAIQPLFQADLPFTQQIERLSSASREAALEIAGLGRAQRAIQLTNLLGDEGFVARLESTASLAETALGRLDERLSELVAKGSLSADLAERLRNSFTSLSEESSRLSTFAAQAAVSFSDWLTDSLLQVNSLRDGIRALGEALLRLAVQSFIGAPLSEFFQNIAGRQFGGPVRRGQPYIVGESGEELFVPSTSGTIIPNSGLGGVTIQNLNVSGVVDSHIVTAEMRNAIREVALEVIGENNA